MYLHYRSVPYSSPLWEIIIGKEEPETVRVALAAQRSCCDGSGGISKIRRYVYTLPQAEKERAIADLETCLTEACNAYTANGHCSNHKEEGGLRDCTTLSLRRPFRSVTFRTMHREHGIKFANTEQRSYYANFAKRFFGSTGLMRKQMRYLKTVYNGFTWFRHCIGKKTSVEDATNRRKLLGEGEKAHWAHEASLENRRRKEERENLYRVVANDPFSGTFGSVYIGI